MRKLIDLDQLTDNQAKGFRAKGGPILVIKSRQGLKAFRDECPHLGVDLAWNPDAFMDADGEYIQCATHGALFEPTTGECVFGPCIGDRLKPVAVEVRDGAVWIDG